MCAWRIVESGTLPSPGEDRRKIQISENEAWDLESQKFYRGCMRGWYSPAQAPGTAAFARHQHGITVPLSSRHPPSTSLPSPAPGRDTLPAPTALLRGALCTLRFRKV